MRARGRGSGAEPSREPHDDRDASDAADADGARGRWDDLAADLLGEAGALVASERRAEVDEVARAELASLSLADRLRGARGAEVVITVSGDERVHGVLVESGSTWALVHDGTAETLVMLVALLSVEGLGATAGSALAEPSVRLRQGPGWCLRRYARDRARVEVVLQSGRTCTGTLDMVGEDHLELAVHPIDEPRRRGAVTARLVVPFSGIAFVRTARAG